MKTHPSHLETLIVSCGGVGTTTILRFLRKYQSTNHWDNLDGLKHLPDPPRQRSGQFLRQIARRLMVLLFSIPPIHWLIFDIQVGKTIRDTDWLWEMFHSVATFIAPAPKRALYIIGDPVDVVLTMFCSERRKQEGRFARQHSLSLEGDYKSFQKDWGIRQYIAQGKELFGFKKHMENWLHAKRPYPILAVKYGDIWSHKEEILDFLQLPPDALAHFPVYRERHCSVDEQPADIQEGLTKIYSGLQEYVRSLPPIFRVC